ncbi:hypothetical protein [Streptomyces rubellomurinus]|uniref:Uncharacterized protein n=1 Tax=Streptomyces rubellomurinus (strain ATCC 31215) TaxID=359131 RepID=A0A0F2TIJ0_STRR3|nr:hypothetical protein [Streptomyces rubellomurinus]KJS62346.1 hypothetical protein VM95_09145 [Streptomyces rubellomurinus]
MSASEFRWDEPEGQAELEERQERQERELRDLLQQAVPPLPTPEDRMQRVLARADRTRARKRTAGLAGGLTTGLLAAVLAAAPALAPSPGADAAAGRGPAGVAPSASVSASPGVETAIATRFPIYGLIGDLPPGWSARTSADAPRDGVEHLANVPFDRSSLCRATDPGCLPVEALPVDGAVLTVRLGGPTEPDPGEPSALTSLSTVPAGTVCAARGGTGELVGHRRIDALGKPVRIELTGCLREPSGRTLAQIRQVIESIRYPQPAVASPSSPSTPSALSSPSVPAAPPARG